MKRLLFVQHAGSGGAVISLSQILAKLDRTKWDPFVLLLRNDLQAAEMLTNQGAKVVIDDRLSQFRFVVGGWGSLTPIGAYFTGRNLAMLPFSIVKFQELLAGIQPALVYLNALPLCFYAYVAEKLRIPAIVHVREIVVDGPFAAYKQLYRFFIERYSAHTIFIGAYERNRIGAACPHDVIPNYVDLKIWRRTYPSEDCSADSRCSKPPTILFAGGLNRIKGIQVLLPALAELERSHIAFRCIFLSINKPKRKASKLRARLISGDTDWSYDRLVAFLHDNGIMDRCELHPFIPNPVHLYARADILVFPSTEPHFPRPLIEAGAMHLPVVASDLPGPRAVVEHGVNGLLVQPNSPSALADALRRLLLSSDLRQEMGEANHRVVVSKFNATINEQRIMDLINSLGRDTSS